jgi:hypothetical protein
MKTAGERLGIGDPLGPGGVAYHASVPLTVAAGRAHRRNVGATTAAYVLQCG